jgi:hypothetical protein
VGHVLAINRSISEHEKINMENCVICKEFTEPRYTVTINDSSIEAPLKAFVCRFCYNKFIDSYYNKGFFKVSKMKNWIKSWKKDSMRWI